MKNRQRLYIEITPAAIKWCLANITDAISIIKIGSQSLNEVFSPDIIGCEQLIISLGSYYFMSKFLKLPARDVQEARNMIDFQLIKAIPYPLDELVYDFLPIGIGNDFMNVLVFIIKKTKLVNLLDLLPKQYPISQQVTITCQGLVSWFLYQKRLGCGIKQACALVDIDSYHAYLILVENNIMLFSHSFPYSEEQQLLVGLKQCLAAAQKQYPDFQLRQIVYTGIRKEKVMAQFQQIETIFIESANGFAIEELALDNGCFKTSWASLLGLTQLKPQAGLDFSSPAIKKSRLNSQYHKKIRQFAMLGGQILCIFVLLFSAYVFDRYSYLSFLNRQIRKTASEIDKLDKVASRFKAVSKYLAQEPFFSDLLSQLVLTAPSGVQFTYCDVDEYHKLSLKGYADEISDVFVVIRGLKQSNLFGEVKLKYASRLKQRNAKERVEFFIYAQKAVRS